MAIERITNNFSLVQCNVVTEVQSAITEYTINNTILLSGLE